MSKIVRIDTGGDVERLTGSDLLAWARGEFEQSTVVACRLAPILQAHSQHAIFVMMVDDFGAEDMPVNMKAWALYGRSPIFGTAFFAYDNVGPDRPDLPESLIDTIAQPIETWVDAGVIAHMQSHQDRPEMLITRAEAGVPPADLSVANDDHPNT